MTEFDACMEVLNSHRDHYEKLHSDLLAEYRDAKHDGWENDVVDSIRQDKRDAAIRRNLLDQIIDGMEDAVCDKLQEDANKLVDK